VSSTRLQAANGDLSARRALWIGAIQGLCLPFRGLSRSGATISGGLLLGVQRRRAEEFSFAMAVVLVIAKEGYGFYQAPADAAQGLGHLWRRACLAWHSAVAGMAALRWLSRVGWNRDAGISSGSIAWSQRRLCSWRLDAAHTRRHFRWTGAQMKTRIIRNLNYITVLSYAMAIFLAFVDRAVPGDVCAADRACPRRRTDRGQGKASLATA
jgi:hypothetical protein